MFSISIPTFSPYSYNFSGVGDLHGRVCYVKNTVGKKGTTIGNVHAGRSIRAALNVESPPWNDHFIQSLNTPFSDPVYAQREKVLVRDIKGDIRAALQDCNEENGLRFRLSLVESLECLGIDRYFKEDIKEALDYVMSKWSECGESKVHPTKLRQLDFRWTCVAFRLLRLHRYEGLSAECINKFRTSTGSFKGMEMDCNETYNIEAIKTAISLLRACHVQFPEDTNLEEAKNIATKFLNVWLSSSSNCHPTFLIKQVKHFLKYEWLNSSPRWEAKCFIDFNGQDKEWLNRNINKKIMKLAKLDFNILQAMHQEELKHLSKWWNKWEVSKLGMFRNKLDAAYFFVSMGIFQPEFQSARLNASKATMSAYVLDDIFDRNATLEEANWLLRAIKQWDASLLPPSMREFMKVCLEFVLQSQTEVNKEMSEKHGLDLEAYMQSIIQKVTNRYQMEVQWKTCGEVPSMDEYLKISSGNCASWPLVVVAQLCMCDSSYWVQTNKKNPNVSEFLKQYITAMRILDDMMDYEDGNVSLVQCFHKENPGCSNEEALLSLQQMFKGGIKEITKLYLAPEHNNNKEPLPLKLAEFELMRATYMLLTNDDSFSNTPQAYKDIVTSVFFDPVPLT